MVISDENSYPVLIDSIDTPVLTEYFWTLDLIERDFSLTKLVVFEEIWTPLISFTIRGYVIDAPADWNILIYSPDTSQVDLVEISELTKGDYSAFLFDHNKNKVISNKIRVVNYTANAPFHTPSFNKSNMICHPVGTDYWICLASADTFNKYLKDATIGDFLP